MRLALPAHYRSFSVTSEESLRDSYPSTKGQETSRGLKLVPSPIALIHTNLHTVSALVLSRAKMAAIFQMSSNH